MQNYTIITRKEFNNIVMIYLWIYLWIIVQSET